MLIDAVAKFSEADEVTSTAYSENYIDQGAAGDAGTPLSLIIDVDTDVTQSGSGTVTFTLETAAALSGSDITSSTTLWTSTAVAKATLVAGYRVCNIPIPAGCLRYLQVKYTVSETLLTGKFDAYLVKTPDTAVGSGGQLN